MSVTLSLNEIKEYFKSSISVDMHYSWYWQPSCDDGRGVAWFHLSIYSVKCSWKQMEGGVTGVLCYGRKGGGG